MGIDVTANTLEQLIKLGREYLQYSLIEEVYLVLDEDGTEIDEEEYFQTLAENTVVMLLHKDETWKPVSSIRASLTQSNGSLSAAQLANALLEHIKKLRHLEAKESCNNNLTSEDDF